jgi:hypothetical protein
VQAADTGNPPPDQPCQQGITAKSTVGEKQVAGFEGLEQLLEQEDFMLVLVAFGVIKQHAGGQAEDAHQFEQRKSAAG